MPLNLASPRISTWNTHFADYPTFNATGGNKPQKQRRPWRHYHGVLRGIKIEISIKDREAERLEKVENELMEKRDLINTMIALARGTELEAEYQTQLTAQEDILATVTTKKTEVYDELDALLALYEEKHALVAILVKDRHKDMRERPSF